VSRFIYFTKFFFSDYPGAFAFRILVRKAIFFCWCSARARRQFEFEARLAQSRSCFNGSILLFFLGSHRSADSQDVCRITVSIGTLFGIRIAVLAALIIRAKVSLLQRHRRLVVSLSPACLAGVRFRTYDSSQLLLGRATPRLFFFFFPAGALGPRLIDVLSATLCARFLGCVS